jgi:hypothetical protein
LPSSILARRTPDLLDPVADETELLRALGEGMPRISGRNRRRSAQLCAEQQSLSESKPGYSGGSGAGYPWPSHPQRWAASTWNRLPTLRSFLVSVMERHAVIAESPACLTTTSSL